MKGTGRGCLYSSIENAQQHMETGTFEALSPHCHGIGACALNMIHLPFSFPEVPPLRLSLPVPHLPTSGTAKL